MVRLARLTLAGVLVAVSACSEGTGPSTGFVVRGRIQNNTDAPIPADARLVVIWGVTSGSPDYSVVFGEGEIDRMTGTFHVRFEGPPPTEALNNGVMGVGLVVATTDHLLKDGDSLPNRPPTFDILGVTAQHAVIFLASQPDTLQVPTWATAFDTGYTVGVGVKVPGTFDKFVPVSPSTALLIIDALANIEIVNWT
ncbi:MAG TPA: hypothetical protein VGQ18_00190 [Gemmatimonadales bacterium]|jgi:hypothetical protein|nr:hypothetical protein [Gemmatimonadales bacterium]